MKRIPIFNDDDMVAVAEFNADPTDLNCEQFIMHKGNRYWLAVTDAGPVFNEDTDTPPNELYPVKVVELVL